jgi:hypothetical protein
MRLPVALLMITSPAFADPACDAATERFVALATPEMVGTDLAPMAEAMADDKLRWAYVSKAYISLSLRVRMETATPVEAQVLLSADTLVDCIRAESTAEGTQDTERFAGFDKFFDASKREEIRALAMAQQ